MQNVRQWELPQNDLKKSTEAALFRAKLKTNRLKMQKQRTKTEGYMLPLKKCAVFSIDMLRRAQCKKVVSQPACLDFMMQLSHS